MLLATPIGSEVRQGGGDIPPPNSRRQVAGDPRSGRVKIQRFGGMVKVEDDSRKNETPNVWLLRAGAVAPACHFATNGEKQV